MSVTTLRPTSTVQDGLSTVSPSGTRHGVLSDNSDSTYVNLNSSPQANFFGLGFTTPSLPSGSVPLFGAVRVRADSDSDSVTILNTLARLGDSLGWASIFVSGNDPSTVPAAQVYSFDDSTISVALWGGLVLLFEVYFDLYYIEPPEVTVTTPADGSTLTESNRPTITWSAEFDELSSSQLAYSVLVYDDSDAVVAHTGSLDPPNTDGENPWPLGSTSGAATSWRVPVPLVNGDYRAAVNVAGVFNGAYVWSYTAGESEFTVNVSPPDPPAFALTDQPASGRVKIDVTPDNSPVATDGVLIERSVDGGSTWATVDEHTGGSAYTAYDYFAPSGVSVSYRASAWNDTDTDRLYSSFTTHSVTSAAGWWLKHPTDPTLNFGPLLMFSNPTITRAVRQSVNQPLGRSDVVVTSDTRGPDTGSIVFTIEDAGDQSALEELLDTQAPIYLAGRAKDYWRDRWVVFGDEDVTRIADKAFVEPVNVTLPWTEVAAPGTA